MWAWAYFSAQETSDPVFLDSLFEVFGCPVRSGGLLLAGELPLRYYSGNFALRKPSWSLPDYGGVQACCLPKVLVLVWLSSRLLGVGKALGVAGLKELEGLGRECHLPRKRPVRWFADMVFLMSFMVLGGRDFVLLMRLWVQGLSVIRGDVYHCMSMVSFLGKALGYCPWVVALSRVSRFVLN